ncbi:hypothetical protein [Paraburkholderia dilworthii]|uniref:Uncharacterized protein n=1 Tax=Paraburkholderia dilworthii TaxID=948106 RepID=A0ABW9D1H2_9BURK
MATLVVETGLRRGITRIFALSILSEAMLLLVLAVIDMLDNSRGIVLTFCVGGVLGVIAYKALGAVLLMIAATLLAMVALPGVLQRPQPVAGTRR